MLRKPMLGEERRMAEPLTFREAEDELDWVENQLRTPMAQRRLDRQMMTTAAAGTVLLALLVWAIFFR